MIECLIGAMLVMTLFPETAFARTLKRFLVDLPVQRAAALDRRQVIYALALIAMFLLAQDMIMLLGSVDMAMVYAWDLSLYVDAILAATAVVVSSRTTGLRTVARSILPKFRRPTGRRAREHRRRSLVAPAANDDADGPPGIFAVAA
jgi:ABC-type multidrug transport system fused ATPase/permease subunit